MSQVKLDANVREKSGKGVARKLRRAGRVPGVLYGVHMEQPILLDVDLKELESILYSAGRTAVINLALSAGGTQTAMLADYQRDVFGTCVTHVDLKQVRMDEKVTASVPVVLVGNSRGVKAGGVLEQPIREISIEAFPMDIPETIEIDVTDLDMGHHLTVGDLPIPANAVVHGDTSETVVTIHAPRAITAAEAAAAAETAAPAAAAAP